MRFTNKPNNEFKAHEYEWLSNQMKIAIFPSQGLGDGLIQLVLAQNLSILGNRVDYYHHYLEAANPLFNHVNVYRPVTAILKERLNNYDVLLLDHGSKSVDLTAYFDQIKSRIAFYSMSRSSRQKNPDFIAPTLIINGRVIDFSHFNGQSLRAKRALGLNTAQSITNFLTNHKILETPTDELALSIPPNWQKRKYNKRILIHPTSTKKEKNWLPDRILRLASNLNFQGYQPTISVSPAELEYWKDLAQPEFELPCFENIFDLAQYYYESALLIGTDSGNGHLASAMGLSTITIVNRYQRPFCWRPCWGENIIIRPTLSKKLVGNYFWKITISEKKVLKAVGKLLS